MRRVLPRSGNGSSEAKNLLSLGYVHYLKEEYTEARAFYEHAQALIKSLDLLRDRSIYHEYMGDLLRAMGDHKMARQHYGYAIEIGNRIAPQSAIISQTRRRLAALEYDCGNYALAAEHGERALEVAEALGEIVEAAAAKAILGSLKAIKEHHDDAVKLFDEAISCFETTGEVRELADAYYLAGKVAGDSEGPTSPGGTLSERCYPPGGAPRSETPAGGILLSTERLAC